jgi:hypothetical protein
VIAIILEKRINRTIYSTHKTLHQNAKKTYSTKTKTLLLTTIPRMMEQYLEQMKKFIAYHSISTDTQFKNDMSQTANYLTKLLESHGCKTQSIT